MPAQTSLKKRCHDDAGDTTGQTQSGLLELNDTLKKSTPRSNGLRQGFGSQELRGITSFLPFGTGCRPTRCFFRTLQSRVVGTGNDQVQAVAGCFANRSFGLSVSAASAKLRSPSWLAHRSGLEGAASPTPQILRTSRKSSPSSAVRRPAIFRGPESPSMAEQVREFIEGLKKIVDSGQGTVNSDQG